MKGPRERGVKGINLPCRFAAAANCKVVYVCAKITAVRCEGESYWRYVVFLIDVRLSDPPWVVILEVRSNHVRRPPLSNPRTKVAWGLRPRTPE
jgi:hypothetical protein